MNIRTILGLSVYLLLVTGFSVSAHAEDRERGVVREGIATPRPYRRKLAVVVGIDYKEAKVDRKVVPELKNAENDAQAFQQLLIRNYGYQTEDVSLLLGGAATRKAVQDALAEGQFCGKNVNDQDSVLFYFSGHGFLRTTPDGKTDHGELLPSDTEINDSAPASATTINLTEVVAMLNVHCPARHKLLILDCCHSGAIFRLDAARVGGKHDDWRTDRAVLYTPGFQAISSSRERQNASDGTDAHSPFTHALMRALETIPVRQGPDRPITANGLFKAMQIYLDDRLPAEQSPQCQWLTMDQGEFHFFPSGEFPEELVPDDKMQQMLVAMVPGVFGTSWFDETPWLMPSLRFEIMEQLDKSRSISLDVISRNRLEKAANDVIIRLREDNRPQIQRRLRHLKRLLSSQGFNRQTVLREIETDLRTILVQDGEVDQKSDSAEPVDVHYLAVLSQSLDRDSKEVHALFEKSLEGYRIAVKRNRRYQPLLAMCLADFASFQAEVEYNYKESAHLFHNARDVFAAGSPAPFQIFTLCQESDALRQLGRWQVSNGLMAHAIELAELADKSQSHPLVASAYRRAAWGFMEQWKFSEAGAMFLKANAVLDKFEETEKSNYEVRVVRFHNEHGLAMAKRFSGDSAGAIETYRALLPRILQAIEDHRELAENDANYADVQYLLAERWVNSHERLADCHLFNEKPDLAEAADDYRRAASACDLLAKDKAVDVKVSLLYKRALALCLPSPAQDLELSRSLRDHGSTISEGRPLRPVVKFHLKLVAALLKLFEERTQRDESSDSTAGSSDAIDELRAAILSQMHDRSFNGNVQRDDLESLMFATRILLEHGNSIRQRSEAYQIQADADLLVTLCRFACKGGTTESLGYLRQYFDAAMLAKIVLRPKHVKDLIEFAWESANGTPYTKPREPGPCLVLHVVGDCPYFLLDVPNHMSNYYCIHDLADADTLSAASQQRRLLPLPRQLKHDLLSLPEEIRAKLFNPNDVQYVRWRDPVRRIGSSVGLNHVAFRPVFNQALDFDSEIATARKPAVNDDAVFPFDLTDLLAARPPIRRDRTGGEEVSDTAGTRVISK